MALDEPTEADLQKPEHWRAIAEETREKANAMDAPDLKERMLEIAAEYESLAIRLESRSNSEPLVVHYQRPRP